MIAKKVSLLVACSSLFVSSSSIAACITGYSLIKQDEGVEMCSKSTTLGGTVVVQIIDLYKGGGIKSLYMEPEQYGDDIPRFKKLSTEQFTIKPFSIVNGTYFDGDKEYNDYRPQLAYPLKENNTIITKGYSRDMILGISQYSTAYIKKDDGNYSNFIQVIGGQASGNSPNRIFTARNVVGVNSTGSKIYILVASRACSMTASSAETAIKEFGADKIMHLDGSGSARLRSDKISIQSSDGRFIPHAIGVFSKSQKNAIIQLDKCLTKYQSLFGRKVGSLHSDCMGDTSGTLYCQSTSAGITDSTKARKIGIFAKSLFFNSTPFFYYRNSSLWSTSYLSSCN